MRQTPTSSAPSGASAIIAGVRGLLWTILILAAALRLFPIWFGLPHPYTRPDEEVAIGRAVMMLEGDPHPHFFHWPSLTFYAFAALYTMASWVRAVLPLDSPLTQTDHILLARGFVALAGTATVAVLYRIGRRVADPTTGLIAAALLAVAVLHVRDSHFAMTDTLMTLFATLSLALLLRAYDAAAMRVDAASLRLFAAAGLAGGLAASTKYSGAAVVAAMAAAQVLLLVKRTAGGHSPYLASVAFLGGFALGFVSGTPYAVLDFQAFSNDLRFDFMHLSQGHEGVNLGPGWIYHATHSLPYGAGVPVFAAALAGLVPMTRHYGRHACVLGGFFAAFYVVFGSGLTVFFRYILPLIPLVCLLAAVALRHGAGWLASRTGLPSRAVLLLLVAIVGGPGLVNSARLDARLARTDSRVLAARWLDGRVQPGESVYDAGRKYTRLRRTWTTLVESGEDTADWLVLHDSPLRAYASTSAALRDLAAEQYELAHTIHGAGEEGLYDLQDAFFLPITGFSTGERPGPTIRIYRRRQP